MPIALQKILSDSATRLSADVVDEIKNKRLTRYGSVNASGKLAASVTQTVTETGYTIRINDYAEQLIYGRAPGQMPPLANIAAWARLRGIRIPAFVIARKIAREGTEAYKVAQSRGGTTGLFEEALDREIGILRRTLIDQVRASIIQDLTQSR